jgi:hypothetical protein
MRRVMLVTMMVDSPRELPAVLAGAGAGAGGPVAARAGVLVRVGALACAGVLLVESCPVRA